ncbi:MAG: terminase family protein [Gammaproteobacteria bacterium]|nr:terminase family protein [Gammaproteobacteria bacterium]
MITNGEEKRKGIVIPYTPRTLQAKLHNELDRFNVVVCHRRFGKTVFAINQMIKSAIQDIQKGKKAPRYAYLAPLFKQAKTVAWDELKRLLIDFPGVKFNEAELRADFMDARIQLYGADNPDTLRGIYLDGVILDEYAQMNPKMYSEVIRPALSDRKGWGVFIGTPKGKNEFYDIYHTAPEKKGWKRFLFRASETGILDDEELEMAKQDMAETEYEQEYECSWSAALRGAYYAKELEAAYDEDRVGKVPYDPSKQVVTSWDLGVADSTAVWFAQYDGKSINVIDYYESSGEGLPHYIDVLNNKGYRYGAHIAPHDIAVREFSTGKSRKDLAYSLGIDFQVAPKLKVMDGIDTVRTTLNKCWFDQDKCQKGLDALLQYRSSYNDKKKIWSQKPVHDWTSHASDAFRYLCVTDVVFTGNENSWGSSIPKQDLSWVV